MITFSEITHQWDVPTNRLYRLRDDILGNDGRISDLISGNVNAQGIFFPERILKKAMADGARAAKTYHPDPLGHLRARKAVSRFYSSEGCRVPENQILITPGTSMSYWYAFKLLANPGDEILCPCPSYPLFDAIAALCGIALIAYPLREGRRWEIDFERLEASITPKTKALVLISPHNPTGAVATEEEVGRLGRVAAAHGLPIISDEVFSLFLFQAVRLPRPLTTSAPLVLTLNGLSKMSALPGMKIGWMAITGEPALIEKSLKTLTMISDTFLPVSEAAQFALPSLLKNGAAFQKSYVSEIRKRKDLALALVKGQKNISCIDPEGGFFLTLRLEQKEADEEEIACRLLKKHRILVHPGYFYDMEGQHLVISFVNRAAILRATLPVLLRELDLMGRIDEVGGNRAIERMP